MDAPRGASGVKRAWVWGAVGTARRLDARERDPGRACGSDCSLPRSRRSRAHVTPAAAALVRAVFQLRIGAVHQAREFIGE